MKREKFKSLDATSMLKSCLDHPGLYLHIPFCQSLCPFCPYNKILYQEELAERYIAALQKEVNAYLDATDTPFTSLYIGGGTPTLCLDSLVHILPTIPVRGERAIEVLPNHANPQTLAKLQAMGITYVSLGIQSFDAGMLHYLHRPHTVDQNIQALENTVGHFACVDVDLIFDVAFQHGATFLEDVERCFRYGVDQLSTYPLMRFGYTPFGKARHDPQQEHAILSAVETLAARYGYERRSVWTFNKVDSPTYTSITREFYIGLGAGAATYTGKHFLVNHFSVDRYLGAIKSGHLPLAKRLALGRFKRAAYYLFWQTYTGSINTKRLRELFPEAHLLQGLLKLFSQTGHLSCKNEIARLTSQGYDRYHDLERWVTYHFIEPLWAEMQREHQEGDIEHLDKKRLRQQIWLALMGAKQASPGLLWRNRRLE